MSTLEHDADNNSGPLTRDKLVKELGKFGTAFGKGQNSRPAAAIMCVDAASRNKDVGPDDAETLYTEFSKAAAKAAGIEYAASASQKVQVSKLKRFLMLGSLPAIDGVDVINRATDKIVELSRRAESPLKGSAYDNMVTVARRQIEQPTVALSDDEIEEILSETPDEKTELDMVIDAYKKTYRLSEKLAEAGMDHQHVDDATELFAAQIKEMGGDLPPMTKEEKQIAKAQSVMAKHGMAAVPVASLVLQPVAQAPAEDQAAA